MGRKFSIIRAVDLNELNMQIEDYKCETHELEPYIFANEETIKAIVESININWWDIEIISKTKGRGIVGRYEGYKLFPDNELKFGEVEIR